MHFETSFRNVRIIFLTRASLQCKEISQNNSLKMLINIKEERCLKLWNLSELTEKYNLTFKNFFRK